MAKKAILITGVAGLIGSKLADWILHNHPEYNIIGVDDLSDGIASNVDPRIEVHFRDCAAPLDDIFIRHEIEYVFHFAARAAESMSGFNRMFFHSNNIVASGNIINHCISHNVKRLVFASSMSVYGNNKAPFTEDQIPLPIDPYGIGKYAVELDLYAAYLQHGLEYSIFRGHSIYGDKQNIWDRYRNVLGIWMRQILSGESITMYGDGTQRRAFTFIEDILPALWQCAVSEKTKNQTYNFGHDDEITLNMAAEKLANVVGSNLEIKHLPAIHEVKFAYCDHSKSRNELGLECSTPLFEGMKKMWLWAEKQPIREVKHWTRFEIDKGLYDMWKK